MGDHIVNGQFKSDKYAWSPPGFVPLKLTDPMAHQPLWDYAQARRAVDAEFADDLEAMLKAAGFVPPDKRRSHYCLECSKQWFDNDLVCRDKRCPFKVGPPT